MSSTFGQVFRIHTFGESHGGGVGVVIDGCPPRIPVSLENIQRVYYGVVATYEHPFSAEDKDAITQNMLVMGKVQGGAVTFAYPEDAKRNLFVQRKK